MTGVEAFAMLVAAILMTFLLTLSTASGSKQSLKGANHSPDRILPFQNASLPWNTRVDDLVGRLTLDEVIGQLANGGAQAAPAIQRLNISQYMFDTECLRGDVGFNATAFPQSLGLAASFEPLLVYLTSEATAEEVRGRHNDAVRQGSFAFHTGASCFSPVINVMRHPLWGRNQPALHTWVPAPLPGAWQETYGEDPYLTGVMAAGFVQGLQGSHPRYIRASSGCKHFAAYDGPESYPVSRHNFSAQVSMYDMRSTFLPAFRTCVMAGTYNIMCSYNSINGTPTCADRWLLTEVLRQEWGFQGYVISDEGALQDVMHSHQYITDPVEAAATCVNAGCNQELNGGSDKLYYKLGQAVQMGKVTELTLRELVKPLFYTRMRLGEFDPPSMNPYSALTSSAVLTPDHVLLAVEAAKKSFVLLKNANNFLPLTSAPYDSLAVVGPMADNVGGLMGNYAARPDKRFIHTPRWTAQQLGRQVHFASGCSDTPCTDYRSHDVIQAVKNVDLVIVCLGTGTVVESEGRDRKSMDLPGSQLQLLQDAVSHSKGGNVLLLLFNAGPVDIRWAVDSPDVAAILECFFPAQATGEALRQVLLNEGEGSVPAGRLPYTWPQSLSQVGSITDYDMAGKTYRYMTEEPLFPFGFGLSYSSFQYSQLILTPIIQAGQNLSLSLTVTNMGQMVADEAVQVYLWWEDVSRPGTPLRQLVGVSRVTLQPSSPTAVHFLVQPHQMALWTDDQGWVVSPGKMGLSAGGQQPSQARTVPSNVLMSSFQIMGTAYLGRF